jgi:hypothetical protein
MAPPKRKTIPIKLPVEPPSTCGNCRYSHNDRCHESPPVVMFAGNDEAVGTYHPSVDDTDPGCSRHKPKLNS